MKDTVSGQTSIDTVDILINSQAYVDNNASPTADAGPDLQVAPGAVVKLDASGSTDPENRIISYLWTVQSGSAAIRLSDDKAIAPVFTAPAASGSAEFKLTVINHDAGKSDTDMVTVNWANQPPSAGTRGPDWTVTGRRAW